MEQLTTATLTQLPQVRALGRHTGRDPLTLFWTASGMELEFTGSELWVDLFADYEAVEPWVSVELNGTVCREPRQKPDLSFPGHDTGQGKAPPAAKGCAGHAR